MTEELFIEVLNTITIEKEPKQEKIKFTITMPNAKVALV
jgi:hypothetical protein